MSDNKTSLGLEPNISALLAYLFGWVGGLVFLLTEKDNRFVRFSAAQSIALDVIIVAISIIYGILTAIISLLIPFISILFSLIGIAFGLCVVIAKILLAVKAYNNQTYKIPYVGDYVEKMVFKA